MKLKAILASCGSAIVGFLCLILHIQRKKIKKQDEEIQKANAIINKQADEFNNIHNVQEKFKEIDSRQEPIKTSKPIDNVDRLNRLNAVVSHDNGRSATDESL